MIDFLKKCNFSDSDIRKIEEVNSDSNLYNLNCNEFDVVKIVDYLYQNGIRNILQILMYDIDMFFTSFEDFKNNFDNKDKKILNIINQEYNLGEK